ncbi:hypothetical protein [Streptomyces sp. NPDC053427]|uniref:effector-associated constant component EACC1 n=1 Tax=Streptomyces sp. NPDC053427 TaxID=3365701 RepID=UPI0037D22279
MQVDIVVDGETDGENDGRSLTSLYRWLASDPDAGRRATLSLVPGRPGAGDMGGAFDVINAVVANGIALGGLAVACATWRASRPAAPAVRIERDGVTITVEDGSPDTVNRIVEALGRPPLPDGDGDPDADGDGDGDPDADGDGRADRQAS